MNCLGSRDSTAHDSGSGLVGSESQQLEPAENFCTNLIVALIVVTNSDSSQIARSGAMKENHFGLLACRLSLDSYSLISSNEDFVISLCLRCSICPLNSSATV